MELDTVIVILLKSLTSSRSLRPVLAFSQWVHLPVSTRLATLPRRPRTQGRSLSPCRGWTCLPLNIISIVAARGIFSSAIATGVLGFITAILFLFCTPDFDTFFSLNAPQPFVQIYSLALGRGGAVFMSILAIAGLVLVRNVLRACGYALMSMSQNTSIAVVAASRLIFAVARDGVLPGSRWIGQVTSDGQPRNAVTVMFIFGAAILCTILPSQVAFTSLVSASAVPTIAAYGLIGLLRLTMTPNSFKSTQFKLGRFRKFFYLATTLFNALALAVSPLPGRYSVKIHCALSRRS